MYAAEILFPTLVCYLRGSSSRELELARVIFIAAVYYKQMIFLIRSYIEHVYLSDFLIILDGSGCTNSRYRRKSYVEEFSIIVVSIFISSK